MNNEYHDDLNKTRRYLQLDPDELENVRAEQAKYERRKAAMAHADANSRVEPVSFAPIRCAGCSVLLTTQNHAGERRCEKCFASCVESGKITSDKMTTVASFEEAQARYLSANASRPIHWLTVFALVVLAGLAAWGLGDLIAQLAWSAGK